MDLQPETLGPEETRRRLRELCEHKIELEVKNRELRESEEYFRAIFEDNATAIAIIEPDTTISFVNAAYCQMTGYTRQDVVGKSWTQFIPPDECDRLKEYNRRRILNPKDAPERYELKFYHCNGEVRHAQASVSVMRINQKIISLYVDITARKQAEDAINRALAQSRSRADEVSALLEGARIVLDYADFGKAARRIFDVCCSITGASAGYVALFSEDGNENEVLFLEAGDLPVGADPGMSMATGGLRELVCHLDETVHENDLSNSRWINDMPAGHVRLDNALFAPLAINGKVQGVLGLANKSGGFTDNDDRLVSAFAELAAVSLRNSRTLDSLEENEKRLQEAHDVLEERIKERTLDLTRANEQLMEEMARRQRAAEALWQSEERYRSIFENAIEGIYQSTPDGRFISVNPSMARICGYESPEEMVTTLTDISTQYYFDPCDRERYISLLTARGQIDNIEYRIYRKDKSINWVLVNARVVRNDRSDLLYFEGTILDITERKKTEIELKNRSEELYAAYQQLAAYGQELEEKYKELEESQRALLESAERYKRITDSITDYIYTVHVEDSRPVKTFHSPACQVVTGYSPDELAADPELWLRMVDETYREAVLAFSREILTTAFAPPSIELQIVRKDGARRWVRNTLVPFRDSKGSLLYYDGLIQDITELKHSEAQVLKSKQTLQAVFDGISEPLVLLDRKKTIKMVNMAAVRYYQFASPQDIIGRSGCGEIGMRRNYCESCPIPSAVSGDKIVRFERKGYMDPERIESVTIFPVAAENEEDSGAVIRISDITDASMMEKTLLRSEKLASIGVLSSGIAHEINNPNNFIMFNIPVLRRYLGAILPIVKAQATVRADPNLFGMSFAEFERDIFDLTDSIENGSERIKNIVAELKDFSCLGDLDETAWGNPEQTIMNAVRISRVQLKGRVKRLDVNIPNDLPDALFSARGLEQVIVNLLINAAHAADKEDSWISLKAKAKGEGNRFFVIEITDNGCGIDEKDLERIFDPFFTTKPPGLGTGLGLYVCHNLIEKAGGSINVDSRVGEGASFRIMLLCK